MNTFFQPPVNGPDNSAVLARARARAGVRPLGDYPADLPNRVMITQDLSDKGPVTSPTVQAPLPTDDNSFLRQIRDLLSRMPTALSDEFRTRFIIQPRETWSFIAPGGPVSVGVGAAVAVVDQKIGENFAGFLTAVGVQASAAALANIMWQIRINGSIHPLFSNRVFNASNLATPIPFAMELTQSSRVQLVALNGGGAPVDVSGVLVGWTELLQSYKRYGSTPQSGIG
ncbi:MAG: hypothetical protein GZ088_09715 [Acidipila sp.]|nr:hypothetical protein [Acidipila sp.]